MRSLKKTFWAGFIFLIAICFIYNLFLLLYNFLRLFLRPLKELLFLAIKYHIPGLELVLLVVFILIFGLLAHFLSRQAPSKIPIINQIFKFSRALHKIAHQLETGEIKTAIVKISEKLYLLGITSGESIRINGKEMIIVLLPSTPNPTTGYAFVVPKEDIEYLPKDLNKFVLKTILTAGLLK